MTRCYLVVGCSKGSARGAIAVKAPCTCIKRWDPPYLMHACHAHFHNALLLYSTMDPGQKVSWLHRPANGIRSSRMVNEVRQTNPKQDNADTELNTVCNNVSVSLLP